MESSSAKSRPIIIYPIYFKKVPRSRGRRVPLKYSGNFSLKDIERAAKELGYRVEVEKDKNHPAAWWEGEGRLVVYTDESKEKVILKIAQKITQNLNIH